MSIKDKIRVIGKYVGEDRNGTIIGGVLFKKNILTDAYVKYEDYLELDAAEWFQIEKGSTGESTPGPKGDKGEPGPKGPKGDPGIQGPKGDTGARGEKGDAGSQGPKGTDGAQGADGTNGTNGKSVELQMSGTNLQWRQEGGSWTTLVDIATLVNPSA